MKLIAVSDRSCILFNMALEKVIRLSGISTTWATYTMSLQILAYADHIDIINRPDMGVVVAFRALQNVAILFPFLVQS